MAHTPDFPLHRPELTESLRRGDQVVGRLMAGNTRTLAAGTVLVARGEEHEYVYRLQRGWVGRLRTLPDGRQQIILLFLPGDLFAVKSMFVSRHIDDVQVLSDAVVEQVEQRRLHAAFESDPDVALRCALQIVEEERRLHNWVVSLGRGRAEERMAALLLNLRGRLAQSGSIAADAGAYDLPLTQEQLGQLLGLSNVHVNRVLKSLRDAGTVAVRGRQVVIGDPPALLRIAAPLLDDYEQETRAFAGRGTG